MGNCLKTQLKESVNNNNLPYFGAYRLNILTVQTPTSSNRVIGFTNQAKKLLLEGDAYFTDSSLSQNLGKELDVPSGASQYNPFVVYVSNDTGTMYVFDNWKSTSLGSSTPSFQVYLEDAIARKDTLTTLYYIKGSTTLEVLKELPLLTSFTDDKISGTPTMLQGTILESLSVGANVYGKIEDFAVVPTLEHLSIVNANITGDFEDYISALRVAGKNTGSLTGWFAFGMATIYDPDLGERIRLTSDFGTPTSGLITVTWDATTITINGKTINA